MKAWPRSAHVVSGALVLLNLGALAWVLVSTPAASTDPNSNRRQVRRDPGAARRSGDKLAREGDWPGAVRAFREAVEVRSDPDTLKKLLLSAARARDREAAAWAVDRTLELAVSSASIPALEEALYTANELRLYERLGRLANRLIAEAPEHPTYRLAHALAERRAGNLDAAIAGFRAVLESPETDYHESARYELALALSYAERHRDALREVAALLVEKPYDARAYALYSRLLARLGRRELSELFEDAHHELEDSQRHFLKAEEYTAAGLAIDARLREAQGLIELEEFRQAEAILRGLAEGHAHDPRPRMVLGELLFRSGRTVEAIETLEPIASVEGPHREILRQAKELLGRWRSSRSPIAALWNKLASSAWPEAEPILRELAERARAAGRLGDARRYARLAVQADPESAEALDAYLEFLDRPTEAFYRLHYLRRLRRLRSDDPEVAARLEAATAEAGLESIP